jgi:hypothetical protein
MELLADFIHHEEREEREEREGEFSVFNARRQRDGAATKKVLQKETKPVERSPS